MRGPIDYIIVGFKDLKFDGSILEAVSEAIDSGAIALVEMLIISKNAEGAVTTVDISDTGDDAMVSFVQKYPSDTDVFSEDDVAEVGDLLEVGETAGLLVVEQLWAKPLKEALLNANGVLIAEGRIHPEAAAELSN